MLIRTTLCLHDKMKHLPSAANRTSADSMVQFIGQFFSVREQCLFIGPTQTTQRAWTRWSSSSVNSSVREQGSCSSAQLKPHHESCTQPQPHRPVLALRGCSSKPNRITWRYSAAAQSEIIRDCLSSTRSISPHSVRKQRILLGRDPVHRPNSNHIAIYIGVL